MGDVSKAAQYFRATSVAATFGEGSLCEGIDHRVATARRTGAGEAELHERERDVFYVIEGEATFITGGTMLGEHEVEPGQWRGTGIDGGEEHELKKGDVIVVPAGLPHWFKLVPQQIDYFVVKVIH